MRGLERHVAATLLMVFAVVLSGTLGVQAHKIVTSPYTYNEHVFPILRDHCGGCHVDGGPAPMSLLSYMDKSGGAVAWAQSIREMLVSEAMPPWYADATGPVVEHMHPLSAHDLDVVITWASGGTPEGDAALRPSPVSAHARWAVGEPDVVIAMPGDHTLDAKTPQETFEMTLPTGLTSPTWVRAADLLPGTPSIVRRALISVVDGPVLRVWEPGEDVPIAPAGTAFLVPPAAKLRLQIFYKKTWQEEQDEKSDRSSIGLYFTQAPASGAGIDAMTLHGEPAQGDAPMSFSGMMNRSARVLALRPQLDRPYGSVEITATLASGDRVPLLRLHAPRPEWPRRYWLRHPVDLPAGTKIEQIGTPSEPDADPASAPTGQPLQLAVDFVPQ